MDKKINNNGFDYVDLDLPSGTLWATQSVGASRSSDFGLYFQWGDTKGCTKDQVGKDKKFTWLDYKFSVNGSNTEVSKYTKDGETLLEVRASISTQKVLSYMIVADVMMGFLFVE